MGLTLKTYIDGIVAIVGTCIIETKFVLFKKKYNYNIFITISISLFVNYVLQNSEQKSKLEVIIKLIVLIEVQRFQKVFRIPFNAKTNNGFNRSFNPSTFVYLTLKLLKQQILCLYSAFIRMGYHLLNISYNNL